ncbi:MAG: hypothetical protein ACOY0T_08535 [Myxococcota bacterium]
MAERRWAPLKHALLASATRKLHLGVASAGVGLAVLTRAFDIGGATLPAVTLSLGLLAYLAMIGLDVIDPKFVRASNERLRIATDDDMPLLAASSLLDPAIREQYQGILHAFQRCRSIFESSGEALRKNLDEGLKRSQQLVLVAGRAARRAEAINRHLASATAGQLEAEVKRLQDCAERTRDVPARDGFLQAADAKSKELETYRQLEGLRDRIHAQLHLIEASLDGLSAKLVKLDASDLSEAISVNESLEDNLRTMTSDVELLESTYEETLQELRS